MKEKLSKLINVYKKYGFIGFNKKIGSYIKANYLDKISLDVILNHKKYQKYIKNILNNTSYQRIIIWRSTFGFNVPLYQRPQHIASNLAKENCLVFYEVTTMTDKVKAIKKEKDNLYLVNFNNAFIEKIIMKEINKQEKPKYLQIYSTDWHLTLNSMQKYLDNGFKLIYEYIDHLAPELAGTKELPKNIIEKYEYAMNHKEVYVVVTAESLKEEVLKRRGKENLAFSSNGVDYKFFKDISKDYKFDSEFLSVLSKGKPIIMYYGALAKWFDYSLLEKIAKTNKYSIVLFGVKYDESYDEELKYTNNIYFLGSRDYKVLKNYASKADILTIPFKINDITASTSPVKIFEYMALHKPIVTTKMRECLKYKSVLIGENHEDFLRKLEKALELKNNSKYINTLDKEAKDNDWSAKAKAIVDLIKKDEK